MKVDERLEFLLQSTESLHDSVGKLAETVGQFADKMNIMTDAVNVLLRTSSNHETGIQKLEED